MANKDLERTQRLTPEDIPWKTIPMVCSWCKQIYKIEQWKFSENQRTGVSHGICPDCLEKQTKQMDAEKAAQDQANAENDKQD